MPTTMPGPALSRRAEEDDWEAWEGDDDWGDVEEWDEEFDDLDEEWDDLDEDDDLGAPDEEEWE